MTTLGASMDVGIRELKGSLSKYVKHVQSGGTVTVTDRGRPVAKLVPVGAPTAFERLIAEGRITPAKRRVRPRPQPIKPKSPIGDLLDEQRR